MATPRRASASKTGPRSRAVIALAMPCRTWRRVLPDVAQRAEAAAHAALDGLPAKQRVAAAELSLVLADDAQVRALNKRWRGIDKPTNVLSFPSGDRPQSGRPALLGDVVLAFETVTREAAEQGKSIADHMAHLITHGVLHLVGFDHEADAEAERMERLERRVLAGLGIADPYRERAHG